MNGVFSLRNLYLALGASVVFLLLSFILLAGDSQSMAFSNDVVDTVFAAPIMGTRFMWNLVWLGVALVFLHLVFGALCWVIGSLSAAGAVAAGAPTERKTSRQHVILWFLLLCFALLAYNCANFTRSSMGARYAVLATQEFAGIRAGSLVAYLVFIAAALAGFNGVFKRWRAGWRPLSSSRRLLGAALGIVAVGGLVGWSHSNRTHNDSSQPNVVLIGIDSLRADMVSDHAPADAVPHIREFLQGAVSFPDAVTPLARTFPSVMSLMSGRDPHSTGAYMNLPPRDFIKEGETLSRTMRKAGYRSVFAMDEVRFANFDTSYGFDQSITPRPGATEFVEGLVADTPLSNLVMNSVIGKVLFPYVHANRGAGATYNPDSFVRRIDAETDFSGPLVFHTHLTLAHWPYSWSDSPLPGPKDPDATWPDYYLRVTHRVDQQFADLMQVLKKRGVLENALVVVYSDHGESFGKPSEALVPSDGLAAALGAKPGWGHGSTVFSLHQYKIVLGMRGFGSAAKLLPAARSVVAPVSIMDVTPTLVELLGVKSGQPYDGFSLVPLLAADSAIPARFQHRVRFTETEYNPVGVASQDEGKMNMSSIAHAAEVYTINPISDRVNVRPDLVKHMLDIRQYAAIGDELMLGALPFNQDGLSHQFVVFSKSGGTPYLLDGAPLETDPPELHRLWNAMQSHLAGIIPTAQQLAEVVAKYPVAPSGQSSTPNVTK